jgi:hypothetical protein
MKTLGGKKQLHIIGVKQQTDLFKNHRTPDVTLISLETALPILIL